MTKIKICGLSRPEDIFTVNKVSPDYIGFVFARSKRQVSDETAKRLKGLLNPEIKSVGVFVNEDIERITRLYCSNIIDIIQLHGDEDQEYIKRLRDSIINVQLRGKSVDRIIDRSVNNADDISIDLTCDYSGAKPENKADDSTDTFTDLKSKGGSAVIIKAVRVKDSEDIKNASGLPVDYLLFDTFREKEYGGSGIAFDWSLLSEVDKPFFLAGGINSGNVLSAIAQCKPYCVDISSGVETDGIKDPDKIIEIVTRIRSVS